MWGLFWKVSLLAQGCLGHFCPKGGSWLKSVSEKWVILVNMSQDINQKWFQGIAVLGFCSARGKGLAGLKLLASLDAYQIINYQFLQKLIIFFCCLISEEFEKKVSKSGVSWPIAWEGVITWLVSKSGVSWPIAWEGVITWFIRFFQNHAPWGTTHFLSKWFHSERNCLLRRVHYQQ